MSPPPGTVLLIRNSGLASRLIRLGAALRDQPNLSSHVAVVHHTDVKGTTWCIEGEPGGVGQRDAAAYLSSRWLLSNAAQPLTAGQGEAVATTMETLLGTAYDWDAIAADAASSCGMTLPGWDPSWHGTVPAHVVCSSLAAYAYAREGLKCPAGDRAVTPGDWDQFILTRAWLA